MRAPEQVETQQDDRVQLLYLVEQLEATWKGHVELDQTYRSNNLMHRRFVMEIAKKVDITICSGIHGVLALDEVVCGSFHETIH